MAAVDRLKAAWIAEPDARRNVELPGFEDDNSAPLVVYYSPYLTMRQTIALAEARDRGMMAWAFEVVMQCAQTESGARMFKEVDRNDLLDRVSAKTLIELGGIIANNLERGTGTDAEPGES